MLPAESSPMVNKRPIKRIYLYLAFVGMIVGFCAWIQFVLGVHLPRGGTDRFFVSPDGRYRCVATEYSWGEPAFSFRVEDATGRLLTGGDFGDRYIQDVTWEGDEFDAWNPSTIAACGLCCNQRVWPWQFKLDADLNSIAGCAQVQRLFLSGEGVTDAGLRSLTRCNGLRTIVLDQTAITAAGLLEFHNACPRVWVYDRSSETRPISFDPPDDGD